MNQLTHWKSLTNPDYLGAYAFDRNEEKVVTIDHISEENVTGADGKHELCTVAYFKEDGLKPMILNVTNCKAISKLLKTPFIQEWYGKRIILRVQPVKAFGETVDAIRVKPELPKASKEMICADCKQVIMDAGNRTAAWIADYTKKKYGAALCDKCATSRNKANADN